MLTVLRLFAYNVAEITTEYYSLFHISTVIAYPPIQAEATSTASERQAQEADRVQGKTKRRGG
jgi:hypothetical protein